MSRPLNRAVNKENWLASFFLMLVAWRVHRHALTGYWRADDGAHLKYAVDYTPWAYFFDPVITRGQSGANVTPWNVFFYDINLSLFGFDPAGHYAHLLLLVALSAVLLFRVLRLWLPLWPSLIGALVFLLGKPTLSIGQYLMVGHYAMGLLLSLLAIWAWHRAMLIDDRWAWSASALCYLLATTCKEVYVPLPLLLLALPVSSLWQRLQKLWPFLLIAACYAGWRHAVLGQFLGGYNPGGSGLMANEVINQFSAIPGLLAAPGWPGRLEMALIVGLTLWAAARNRLNPALILAAVLIVFVPLIPLTTYPGVRSPDRYLYVAWVMVAVWVAVILPRQGSRTLLVVIATGLLAAAWHGSVTERQALAPELGKQDALYRFVLTHDPAHEALFVPGDEGYWSLVLTAAHHARGQFMDRPSTIAPATIVSDTALSMAMLTPADFSKTYYRHHDGIMQRFDPRELRQKTTQQLAAGQGKPLTVRVDYRNGAIHWNFGPYPGRYLAQVGGVTTTRVPAQGSYPWQAGRMMEIRVCHEAGDWAACSPQLKMKPPETQSIDWRGAAGVPAS
jgi:hypothetical protein